MRIEIFYVEGCPNHRRTVERLNESLQEFRITTDVLDVPVTDSASALAYRFLGSPTVKINGIDVEPSARTSNQFGLMCRTYLDGTKREGLPPIALISRALLEACGQRQADMNEA